MGDIDALERENLALRKALEEARREVWELGESDAVRRAAEAEGRYQLIAEQFPGAAFLFDDELTYLAAAGRLLGELGWDPSSLIGRSVFDVLDPAGAARIERLVRAALDCGRVVEDLDSNDRVYETTILRVDVPTGRHRALAFTVDVTERRAAEARREGAVAHTEALLREVHHRVKNNLQSVQSLLSLASRRVRDPATGEVLQDLAARVRSMATVHELLYGADDQSVVRLDQVIDALMGHLQKSLLSLGSASVELDLEPVQWEAAGTLEIGLILTELVTNAARHALGADAGHLRVQLRSTETGLSLVVADDGAGLVEADSDEARRRPMGLWLVRTLASRLGADLQLVDGPGTCWSLDVPRS